MNKISLEDFTKLELKVGTVMDAEDLTGSEKLIKLKVDLGPVDVILGSEATPESESKDSGQARMTEGKRDIRQVLAGVKQWYAPKDFVGKQVIVVANLEPRTMMGLESQGMILAADSENGPVFLTVPKKVPPGTKVR